MLINMASCNSVDLFILRFADRASQYVYLTINHVLEICRGMK